MKSKHVTRLPARADAALNLKSWVPTVGWHVGRIN